MFSILKHRNPSARDRVRFSTFTGRKSRVTPGSHIDNLRALTKCIMLCGLCEHKFDAKRARYRRKHFLSGLIGECDGCGEKATRCSAFVHEESTLL